MFGRFKFALLTVLFRGDTLFLFADVDEVADDANWWFDPFLSF